MRGRRAAAAAHDVDDARLSPFADLLRHLVGVFVILAEGVGQAGVGIGADQRIGGPGDFLQMLAHGGGAERAIEADGERARMAHRMPERGRRLARQGAARAVGDRARDHDRQTATQLEERLLAGEDGGLGVERVEDRFNQDEIGAAVHQPFDLLGIGDAQVVERHGAEAGIVDVGRHRGGAVGRAEGSGDEAGLAVELLGLQRRALGEAGAVAVEFVNHRLHAVIGLRDARGGEGVGLQNVRARLRVGEMDRLDGLGLGEGQQVVVALQVALAAHETLPAKMALVQLEELHLGAHGPVEHENTPGGLGEKTRLRIVGADGDLGERVLRERGLSV